VGEVEELVDIEIIKSYFLMKKNKRINNLLKLAIIFLKVQKIKMQYLNKHRFYIIKIQKKAHHNKGGRKR
jgi:hypothetical protein